MANNNNSNSNSKKGSQRAPRSKDNPKKPGKKKLSVLVQEKVEYIDYKDVNLLQRFMSDRSKIRSRRVSGNTTQQQREVATAIKNAREMALLPYAKRVATTRTTRPPKDSDSGSERAAAPVVEAVVEASTDEEVEA